MKVFLLAVVLGALVVWPLCPPASVSGQEIEVAAKPFEGVTVEVLTFDGPQIAEPLQRRGPEFEADTGATIHVNTVLFEDLYQAILTDLESGHETR